MSGSSRPAPVRQRPALLAPALLLVVGMAVATHSVVRYRLWIVAVYTVLAALLAFWLLRRPAPAQRTTSPLPAFLSTAHGAVAAALALTAVLHLTVRPYTYLTPGDGWAVRWVYAAGALLAAAALAGAALTRRPRLADLGLAAAAAAYLVAAVALIHLDPRPKIDVWVTLQQAADGIARGDNMYGLNWTGSPGVQDAFTYLPLTALLLAPGRWLAGDVRWALVVITLLGVLAVRLLASRSGAATPLTVAGAAAALLVLPGTATQVEQAWTEPLLMACLAGWALGVHRGNTPMAVVCLALGVASKQHLVVLLPLLAAWPGFGLRRAVAAGGLAGLFVLPWVIASPADIWHDTVTTLVNFQPLVFADTLYIAAVNDLSWTPPFWLTGAAVLGTLATAVVQVHRRNPDLGTVLRWAALFLLVANLVNKQAFYNQYWLVAALVVISFAVDGARQRVVPGTAEVSDPRPARPPAAAGA